MTTHISPPRRATASARAGTITLVLGSLFAAAVAYTYVLSLSESFNPPQWVRIIGLVFLPIGFFGAPIAYTVARSGEGRTQGRLGLLIALVGLAAFLGLLIAVG